MVRRGEGRAAVFDKRTLDTRNSGRFFAVTQGLAAQKFFQKNSKKRLHFAGICSMITRHAYAKHRVFMPFLQRLQTARYAMMREVATGMVGFSAEYVRF